MYIYIALVPTLQGWLKDYSFTFESGRLAPPRLPHVVLPFPSVCHIMVFYHKTVGFQSWKSCNSCNWNQMRLEPGNPCRTCQFRLCKMMTLYIYIRIYIYRTSFTDSSLSVGFFCLGLLVWTMNRALRQCLPCRCYRKVTWAFLLH